MAQTILVMAGYRPLGEWMCRCLEADGHSPVLAKDHDETLRIALLLDIDLLIAWPAVSSCTIDEFLAAVSAHPGGKSFPVLVVGFHTPLYRYECAPEWIRPPLNADEFLSKVRLLLDDACTTDGESGI